MATASQIIASARYDLKEYKGQKMETAELLEYLNRAVIILDGILISKDSDWVHQNAISVALSTGQNKITMPTRCASVRSIWYDSKLVTCSDLTFAASGDTIISTATDFSDYFEANDTIGISGSSSNNTSDIGLLSIYSIGDDGAGSNNKLTINEDVIVDEGTGDASATLMRVGENEVLKTSLDYIYYLRKYAATGPPYYWSYEGTNIVFDRQADDDYGLTIHYNQKATVLATDDDMPYNDEFNEKLRAAVVMFAKHRNNELDTVDMVIEKIFHRAVMTKAIRRNYVPQMARLDF